MDIKLLWLMGLLFGAGEVLAQPFECDGDFFLSLTNNGPSIVYRVEIDPTSNDVLFNPVSVGNSGAVINAIGFRSTDNYIYGVDPDNYNLYRVDASGLATFQTSLDDLNTEYQYFAGEISPDGQFLYLLGSGGFPYLSRVMAKIDLDDYTTMLTPIPNAVEASALITDFSFDPVGGSLFGFDLIDNRLVVVNPATGFIDESLYPTTDVADAMGGIFFDAFGNLFGYGDQLGANISNTFFEIDKNTGEVTQEAIGPVAAGKDGCACPYTVALRKIVYPEVAFPCTEVTYVFEVANASAFAIDGVDFSDVMPNDLTISEIVQNPFGGTITSGVGSSVLTIENITVSQGIDSIIVRAEVASGAFGIYKNQAMLTNLPASLGTETISDDPTTIVIDDSTELEIVPLFLDLANDTVGLCTGDDLLLNASTHGVSYLWSDGSLDSTLLVNSEGLYWVEVMTGCETASDSIYVFENTLSIQLGPDLEINLGDSVFLSPTISGTPSLLWTDPLENSLSCLSCPDPSARPFFDVEYIVSGVDQFGCTDEDDILITVNKDRGIYIPNVFSPNFDGINDLFFIQGIGSGVIKEFKIFNRWGAIVFESSGGFINDPGLGWNGTFKGKELNSAVFIYYTEIEYLDGVVEVFAGDVTLVK